MNGTQKILIVDDDEQMKNMLKTVFETEGYEVDVAANGKEGLKLMNEKAYQVAMIDVMMPLVDGLQMLKEIRSMDGENQKIKVILMSSLSQDGLFERAKDFGVLGCLDKSALLPKELVEKAEKLFSAG